MMGNQLNFSFSIKAVSKKYPVEFLVSFLVFTCFVFGNMIRIIETPVYSVTDNSANDYELMFTCVWNMFVVMSTGIIICLKVSWIW